MPSRHLRQLPATEPPPDLLQFQPDPTAVATAEPPDHRRSPLRPVLLATSLCVLLLVVAAAALALYRTRRRRRAALPCPAASVDLVPAKQEREEEPPPAPPPEEPSRFSYEQLRRATASFSPSYKLGQGGFGPVFRGALGDGREVAVKVMDDGSLQGEREFRNELSLAAALMAALRDASRHVVFPIGYCSDDDGGGGGGGLERQRKKKRKKKKKHWGEEEEDKWGIRKGRRPRMRSGSSAAFTDEDADGDFSCRGEEGRRARRLLLVYDLMHNGSLQDALLDRRCPDLAAWDRRLAVALDVARALEFLHFACDPPVVHGDIKPSNVLLDIHFSAKIADFGLARVLTPAAAIPALEDDASATIADDLSTTAAETESTATTALDDANSCLNTPAARMRMANGGGCGVASAAAKEYPMEDEREEEHSPRLTEADGASSITTTIALPTLEAVSASEVGGGCDKLSVDSGVELLTPGGQSRRRKKSSNEVLGRDWWWRQDSAAGAGGKAEPSGGTVKEYVMEWIGSEVRKERPKGTWAESSTSNADDGQAVPSRKSDHKKPHKRLDWWASLDEHRQRRKGKNRPREWWREEFCEELAKKNKKKKRSMTRSSSGIIGGATERQWWERDDDDDDGNHEGATLGGKNRRRAWSRGSRSSLDRWADGLSGELRATRRRTSHDWANGDVPKSGGVSSTPSMRGTVCYAAPEYGGGGPLSEKCDIYSFGVLLLVLISGRRPLQVTASPMSEFERANLISWARNLAHAGKLLDLVDTSLHSVNREQALLCVMVALLCLQRSPSRRPNIKEVISMLSGESEPPHLPLDFSPSPPCGLPFKPRRKAR